MRYLELKSIIRHIKKNMPCQGCGRCFKEKDINIMALFQESVFLELACPECSLRTVVQISLLQDGDEISYRQHKLDAKDPISHDEILDMHNFLKDFKGDFKSILKG